jgi:multiple sugar transport system substrate-binding protein
MKFGLKKVFAILLIITMISSLVACSSSSPTAETEGSEGEEPSKDGVVEVVYWHMWTADWKKLIDSLVEEFNQTHPNIHVKALSIAGDANSKFLTSQAGGDPPDVMTQWNQVIPSWADKGAIMSLDQYIDTTAPDLKEWMYPTVAQMGTYQGEMYAVPFSMNSFMLFYNKDIFREVGLDPEDPPETIEELDAIQDELWDIDDRGFINRIGFMPGWLTTWSTAFDGQWADENGNPTATHENNIKTLQWFDSYTEEYDPQKVAAFNKSLQSNTTNGAWPFLSGKTVFAVDGMWRLIDLEKYAPDLDYGVMPLPYPEGDGKPNATWTNGNYNIIPAGAKHPEEAWEFILWLTGYDNEEWASKMLTKGGWIPASPKITEQPAYQAYMEEVPYRKEFVNIFSSKNIQITPVIPVQQYYWDRIAAAEEAVMTGQKSPEEALADVQEEVEKEVKKIAAE